MSAACRSCGEPIKWATTRTGNRLPVDVDPHPDGNVRLYIENEMLMAEVAKHADLFNDSPRHLSHFATCPQADQWRRR